jgi:hypothetical protein
VVKSKGRFAYPLDFYFHLQEEERDEREEFTAFGINSAFGFGPGWGDRGFMG